MDPMKQLERWALESAKVVAAIKEAGNRDGVWFEDCSKPEKRHTHDHVIEVRAHRVTEASAPRIYCTAILYVKYYKD
jgi:hypothetical protein